MSLVSVVVLTWNSRELVAGALDSALAQGWSPIEVIVCDNASDDDTPAAVAARFRDRVRLACLERNFGYAGGYNRALALASGDFVLALNPDVRLAPDFLECAMPAFDDPRVGIVAGRLVRPGGEVDSSGQFLGRSRRTLDRGFGQPHDPARDRAGAVLSACGAAALYRRAMIDDVSDGAELFDEDYFAYHEDLELGWRAWRAGWRAVHVPGAVAEHLRGGGRRRPLLRDKPPAVVAHIVKNRWLAMLRHDRAGAVVADLPWIAARDLALALLVLAPRPAAVRELWRARGAFGRAREKRRADRARSGAWGAWRQDVPPRGEWEAT
ncbi:MAG: glycosyltransferase family 2 protein [Acidobacteria bacterium]|nr:glycosyltransferase family 2 protein [Acidobacteriota bacterium]